MEKHNCGETLKPTCLLLMKQIGALTFTLRIPGLRCTRCGEEVVRRNVAHALEQVPGRWESQVIREGRLSITTEIPGITLLVTSSETGEFNGV